MTRIEKGYRWIAEAAKLSGREDPRVDILRLVRAWLRDESNGKWTVIVDNADDLSLLSNLSEGMQSERCLSNSAADGLPDVMPKSSNGSVLITSRNREAALKLVGDYDNMDGEPARSLFRQKLRDNADGADVLELLQNLDYLPLAISQAAAYIRQRKPRVTVSKYLGDIRGSEKIMGSLLNVAIRDRRRDGKHRTRYLPHGRYRLSISGQSGHPLRDCCR